MIIIVNAEPSPPTPLPLAGEGSKKIKALSPNVLVERSNSDLLSPSVLGERVRGNEPSSAQSLLPQHAYLINFLTALGYDPDYTPVAALLAPSYQIDKPCLVATPIYWKASHNDVMIQAAGSALHYPDSLMRVWCHELNQFLDHDGLHLQYHDHDDWLLIPPDRHLLNAPNVAKMFNRSMMPVLSTLDDSMFWQRLMTEIQMFLAQHPLNQDHTSRASGLTLNGLWFWGAGTLDKSVNRTIYTDSQIIHQAFSMAKGLDLIDFNDETAIVVMEKHDPEWLAHFERQLQGCEVQWIWNQYTYTTGVRRFWLRRLWNYLK